MEEIKLFDVSAHLLTTIKYDHELHIATNKNVVLKCPKFLSSITMLYASYTNFYKLQLIFLFKQHPVTWMLSYNLVLIIKSSVWGFFFVKSQFVSS